MNATDRLGAVLCDIVPKNLRTGVYLGDGRVALVVPSADYDGLVDAMFHMVRQNAIKSTAVLIGLLDVLTAVVSCEHASLRVEALQRHADLVMGDAKRNILTPADLEAVRQRHARFVAMKLKGPLGALVVS